MSRIKLLQSSSTHLALFFSGMLGIGFALFGYEFHLHREASAVVKLEWIILALMFVCAGLFILSFYVTKRINRIVGIADAIVRTGDLSQRIPIESSWDDLSKLSITLNSMLDEIEDSVQAIRTVSNNIAHDLRHPLTRLRNHLEESAQAPESSPQAHAARMHSLIAECDGLLATFHALLRISNLESGRNTTGFRSLSLSHIVHDVAEMYEPLAHEKQLYLTYDAQPVTLWGDRDLLFQLLINLCDNAIKYCPPDATIHLALREENGYAHLSVCDTGTGVADTEKEKIFQRFYRTDKSRSTQGSGLGLSLVKAIVSAHQGSIEVRDHAPQGLCFMIRLPL